MITTRLSDLHWHISLWLITVETWGENETPYCLDDVPKTWRSTTAGVDATNMSMVNDVISNARR